MGPGNAGLVRLYNFYFTKLLGYITFLICYMYIAGIPMILFIRMVIPAQNNTKTIYITYECIYYVRNNANVWQNFAI